MINSISIFLDKNSKPETVSNIDLKNKNWPFSFKLTSYAATIYFNLSQKEFIKLKNELLSLDRQLDEGRKNARVSKRPEVLC